jgi:hypothetical protein
MLVKLIPDHFLSNVLSRALLPPVETRSLPTTARPTSDLWVVPAASTAAEATCVEDLHHLTLQEIENQSIVILTILTYNIQ